MIFKEKYQEEGSVSGVFSFVSIPLTEDEYKEEYKDKDYAALSTDVMYVNRE